MLSFRSKGDFNRTLNYFNKIQDLSKVINLEKYGQKGVHALANATPKDTGLLKESWGYEVKKSNGSVSITWTNDDIENGANVAILIQYGHATKNGRFVKGVDYINPALRPIFEEIAEEVWKEVSRL